MNAVVETPVETKTEEAPVEENKEVLPPEEKPEPDPEEQRMSARFAAISKREKAAVEREKAVRAQEEKIASYKAEIQPYLEIFQNAKNNPQALLDAAGITFEQIVRYHANNGETAPEDKIALLEKKIEEQGKTYQEKLDADRKEREAAQAAYEEQLINNYKSEVSEHVTGNPEQYELIIAANAQDEVWSLIESHFEATKQILSPEEAAQKVEDYLVAETEKRLSAKKLAEKYALKNGTPEVKNPAPRKRSAPTTLSSKPMDPAPAPGSTVGLSREERLKLAAAKLVYTDRPE